MPAEVQLRHHHCEDPILDRALCVFAQPPVAATTAEPSKPRHCARFEPLDRASGPVPPTSAGRATGAPTPLNLTLPIIAVCR
jgi:hypothetical protein